MEGWIEWIQWGKWEFAPMSCVWHPRFTYARVQWSHAYAPGISPVGSNNTRKPSSEKE